jgi:hypothetical protein
VGSCSVWFGAFFGVAITRRRVRGRGGAVALRWPVRALGRLLIGYGLSRRALRPALAQRGCGCGADEGPAVVVLAQLAQEREQSRRERAGSEEIAAWRIALSPGYRFDATRALRQVLARAVLWGMIDVNPARLGVDNPSPRRREQRPFESWTELDAVAANLSPRY